jgi:hypothetical protein
MAFISESGNEVQWLSDVAIDRLQVRQLVSERTDFWAMPSLLKWMTSLSLDNGQGALPLAGL